MATYTSLLSRALLASVGGFLTYSAVTAGAPRAGVSGSGTAGTLALPGNVDRIYDGVNTLVVTTVDGVNHVVRVDKDTKVHGAAALASLERGTPIVVHYTMRGDQMAGNEIDALGADGLKNTEGTVAAVDRVRKTVTVKYATGAIETLKLTHHAATEGTPAKGNRVIAYYTNESGQKVAHYFKRNS